jgi:predicted DNA-binding transcriptional regulator YafY
MYRGGSRGGNAGRLIRREWEDKCDSFWHMGMAYVSRTETKAQRMLEIAERLRQKPRGVAELARDFKVTRRTIERDLEAMQGLFPIEKSAHRYQITTRGPALNDVEALAVYSATRLLVHTGVGERHYRNSLEKLANMVPEPARATLLRSAEQLTPKGDDRVLDLVAQAWFQGRVLRCEYRSSKGRNWHRNEYEVYFYELNRRNLEPYVIAFERTFAKEVRVFKLARMRNVHLLDDGYFIPEEFDPHQFLAGAYGIVVGSETLEVRLRAEPTVANWFRERESHDQSVMVLREFDHGGVEALVTGRTAAGGDPHEMVSFLLGFGPSIEVLEPERVRQRIAADLLSAAERYR